jgi:LEA14-like dessication related protein
MDIVIPLIALALWKYGGAKKASDRLEYEAKGIKWNKDKKNFTFILSVTNPSQTSLPVDNIFGNVFLGDRKIGKMEMTTKTTINKASTTDLRIPIRVPVEAVASVIDIITGKVPKEVKVLGTARSMGIDSPINETLKLEI